MKKQTVYSSLATVLPWAAFLAGSFIVLQSAVVPTKQPAQKTVIATAPAAKLCYGYMAGIPGPRSYAPRLIVSNLTKTECETWHEAQDKENEQKGYGASTVTPPTKAKWLCWTNDDNCPALVYTSDMW